MIGMLSAACGGFNLHLERGSDFFAQERNVERLATVRNGEACAGLWRKSKNRSPEGGGGFHAAFSFWRPHQLACVPSHTPVMDFW